MDTAHPHMGLFRKSFGLGWHPHALGSPETSALLHVSGWSSMFQPQGKTHQNHLKFLQTSPDIESGLEQSPDRSALGPY